MLSRKKISYSGAVILMAVIFILAGTRQVSAGESVFRPFKASFSGTAEWDGASQFAKCQGVGRATNLGLMTSDCTAVLNLSGYGPKTECANEGTGNGLPNVNVALLTADDGDTLALVALDLACEIQPFTSFHGTGVWYVHPSMSTGRFTGTAGWGTLDGNVDFSEGTFEVNWKGRIAY